MTMLDSQAGMQALSNLRTRYPQYDELDDNELMSRVSEKYPQYQPVFAPLLSQSSPPQPPPSSQPAAPSPVGAAPAGGVDAATLDIVARRKAANTIQDSIRNRQIDAMNATADPTRRAELVDAINNGGVSVGNLGQMGQLEGLATGFNEGTLNGMAPNDPRRGGEIGRTIGNIGGNMARVSAESIALTPWGALTAEAIQGATREYEAAKARGENGDVAFLNALKGGGMGAAQALPAAGPNLGTSFARQALSNAAVNVPIAAGTQMAENYAEGRPIGEGVPTQVGIAAGLSAVSPLIHEQQPTKTMPDWMQNRIGSRTLDSMQAKGEAKLPMDSEIAPQAEAAKSQPSGVDAAYDIPQVETPVEPINPEGPHPTDNLVGGENLEQGAQGRADGGQRAEVRPRQFTKSDIVRKLQSAVSDYPTGADIMEDAARATNSEGGTYTEASGLAVSPEEFKGMTQSQRMALKNAGAYVNEDKAQAMIDSMGSAAYDNALNNAMRGKSGRLDDFVDSVVSNPERFDDETKLYAHLYKRGVHLSGERTGTTNDFRILKPEELKNVASVRIAGEHFEVIHGEDGTILKDGIEIDANNLSGVPVDRGSVQKAKRSVFNPDESFVPTDTGEGAQEGQQLGLLGDRYRGGITGKQSEMMFGGKSDLDEQAAARQRGEEANDKDQMFFGEARKPNPGERGFVINPEEAIKGAIKTGKWVAETTMHAARWLADKINPKSWSDAANALVKQFGQAIRSRVAAIWTAFRQWASGHFEIKTPESVFDSKQPVTDTLISKLVQAIRDAKPLRRKLDRLQSAERGRRAGKLQGIRGGNSEGEAWLNQSLSTLKGELVDQGDRPTIDMAGRLDSNDLNALLKHIKGHNLLTNRIYDSITAAQALRNLITKGEMPRPSESALLEELFGPKIASALQSKATLGRKIWANVVDVANLAKSTAASVDISATARQGWAMLGTHPVLSAKAFGRQIKAFFSEDYARQTDARLRNLENSPEAETAKLELTRPHGMAPSQKEEQFMSGLLTKLSSLEGKSTFGKAVVGTGRVLTWPLRASERAYSTYLNSIRADVFEQTAKALKEDGRTIEENPGDFREAAKFINAATGRGNIKTNEAINAFIFSAKFWASRFETPYRYAKNALNPNAPYALRKEAAKGIAVNVLGYLSLAALFNHAAQQYGWNAKVITDPRDNDFGKVKVGDKTTVDTFGGYGNWRWAFQSATGGKVKGDDVHNNNFIENTAYYVRGKLSPAAGAAADYLTGKDFDKQKPTVSSTMRNMFVPMIWRQSQETIREHGWQSAIPLIGLDAIGAGVNVKNNSSGSGPGPSGPSRPRSSEPSKPR